MSDAGCPNCHVANNWLSCDSCGNVICNSCGYDQSGRKRRAANVCPGCNKIGCIIITK